MAVRCYVVPANDPNGHAGQTWCTDDAGNFWPQRPGDPAPGAANPATSPTTPSSNPVPPVNPASGAGAVAGGAGQYVDPAAIKALMDLASQNAQQAYLNARLELEKQTAGQAWTAKQEELAQAAAHDAWQKTIAGREADIQAAATTGYVSGINDVAQRVGDAWARLPPEQRTAANGAAIWKSQVPGLTDAEAAAMDSAGHQFYATNGTVMPPDVMAATLSQITNGRVTGQTATLGREQEQNKTGLALLEQAANLRGPDNAFAYARTLANIPPEMRAQLDAMMQRSGISYGGPGVGAVAGQLSSGSLGGPTQTAQVMPMAGQAAGMTQQAQVMPYTGPAPVQTGGNAVVYQGQPPAAAEGTQTGGNYMTYTGPDSPSANGVQGQPATPPTSLDAGQTQTGGNAMTYAGNPTGTPAQITGLGQISPQQWSRTNSYVQRLMLSGLEAGGSDKSAELDAYQKQLPRYAGPRTARVAA